MAHTHLFSCGEVRKNMPEYLNGELGLDVEQQLRWHFRHCQDCRAIVCSAIHTFRHFYLEKPAEYLKHKHHAA